MDFGGFETKWVGGDPRFADVIVRRWQDFTGSKAVLEESGELFDDLTAQRKAANAEQV